MSDAERGGGYIVILTCNETSKMWDTKGRQNKRRVCSLNVLDPLVYNGLGGMTTNAKESGLMY